MVKNWYSCEKLVPDGYESGAREVAQEGSVKGQWQRRGSGTAACPSTWWLGVADHVNNTREHVVVAYPLRSPAAW